MRTICYEYIHTNALKIIAIAQKRNFRIGHFICFECLQFAKHSEQMHICTFAVASNGNSCLIEIELKNVYHIKCDRTPIKCDPPWTFCSVVDDFRRLSIDRSWKEKQIQFFVSLLQSYMQTEAHVICRYRHDYMHETRSTNFMMELKHQTACKQWRRREKGACLVPMHNPSRLQIQRLAVYRQCIAQ